jgi:hypothetical protein
VLDIGSLQRFSSTTLKQLAKYHAGLAASGGGLVLVGVGDESRPVLQRTGLLDQIGQVNVLAPDPHPGRSFEHGLTRGAELLAELRSSSQTP